MSQKTKEETMRASAVAAAPKNGAHKIGTPVLTPEALAKLRSIPKVEPTPPKPDGRGLTRADGEIRLAYAMSIATKDMSATVLIAKIAERFGMGIDSNRACRILAELRGSRRRSDLGKQRRTPTPTTTPNQDASKHVQAAIELLVSEVPGLRELTYRIENGQPRVTFKVETLQAGSITMRKP